MAYGKESDGVLFEMSDLGGLFSVDVLFKNIKVSILFTEVVYSGVSWCEYGIAFLAGIRADLLVIVIFQVIHPYIAGYRRSMMFTPGIFIALPIVKNEM